jgi:16S rRNA (cytidine1402-2'-O)-methyltransferase
MPGTLFVVATPIGNLEDITLRALRTLREVDLIAAEDTRRTAKLLARHNIRRPMVSLHEHNERREAPRLVERLAAGESIALVSDAGTPGIADPGELLVRLAHERQLTVTPIPGPSAITAALSVSGFPASEFVFMGFPPRSGARRDDWMRRLGAETRTVVAFEAPHRIRATLSEIVLLANRPIVVHREISKLHEELVVSPTTTRDDAVRPQGEFVLVISPGTIQAAAVEDPDAQARVAVSMIGCMTVNDAFSVDMAVELTAKAVGLPQNAVRKAWKRERIIRKRVEEGLS